MYFDQILNTESINECINNRQTAKMHYLQKENDQLQQENEDLRKAVKLNKEALRIAFQPGFGNTNSQGSIPLDVSMQLQQEFTSKLNAENETLHSMLSTMSKERNKAQGIALLQEQVGEENSNFYQEQIIEKEEKIKELRQLIQDKEFVIQEFEKAKGYYDYGQNVLVRTRDITTPNEQSIKLHNEIENLKVIIVKLTDENTTINNKVLQKEEYLRVLKQEILKLRLVIMNPVNYQKMRGFMVRSFAEKGDEDAFMCGAFYKEVDIQLQEEKLLQERLEQEQRQKQYLKDQYDRQHNPLRPVRSNAGQTSSPYSKKQGNQGGSQYGYQNTNNNNNNNHNNNGMYGNNMNNQLIIEKLNERIEYLEDSLTKYSKLFRKEVENNNILVSKIEEVTRNFDECFQNNEILISSNINLQVQIEALTLENRKLKGDLSEYLRMLKGKNRASRFVSCTSRFGAVVPMQAFPRRVEEKVSNETDNQMRVKQTEREVNVSILEDEDEPLQGKNRPENTLVKADPQEVFNKKWMSIREDLSLKRGNLMKNNVLQNPEDDELNSLNRDQAKIYLLNLAKDLYVNSNIKSSGMTRQVLKQIEIGGYKSGVITIFKCKRSMSDPLDYVSGDQQTKYSLNNQMNLQDILQKNKLNFAKKHEHEQANNILNNNNNESREEEGDGDDDEVKVKIGNAAGENGPFNLDMSVIVKAQSQLSKNNVPKKKHVQKIEVDASFISNDGDIDY